MIVDLQPGDFFFSCVDVLGVYDGDTVYLDIDQGFHSWRRSRNRKGRLSMSYRLLRIDAPEIRSLATRVAGTAARDYLISLVMDKPVMVQTLPDPDNFGRYLVEIWLADGTNVNDMMLASGHAVGYVA